MHPSPPASDAQRVSEHWTIASMVKGAPLPARHFLQGLLLCLLALIAVLLGVTREFKVDPVLATGIGLLLGFLVYPRRLFILAATILPLGVVNQLFDKGIIGGHYLEPAHLIALAVGLLAVTWAMHQRRAWAAPGAWSPGVIVAALGLVLLLALLPGSAAGYIFSFWMPTVVLGGLGLSYLIRSAFGLTN